MRATVTIVIADRRREQLDPPEHLDEPAVVVGPVLGGATEVVERAEGCAFLRDQHREHGEQRQQRGGQPQ